MNKLQLNSTVTLKGDIRGGMTGGTVFGNSKHRSLYTVDNQRGGAIHRDLYFSEHDLPITDGQLVRQNVESVAIYREGGYLKCYGVDRVGRSFVPFEGQKPVVDGRWSFRQLPVPDLDRYEFCDLNFSIGNKPFWKANDWTNGYHRRWYTTGATGELVQLTGLDRGPTNETYMLSVFEPGAQEPKNQFASKWKYVALNHSFEIESAGGEGEIRQVGQIIPIWVASNDGIHWEYPFGTEPAIDMGEYQMISPWTPFVYGDSLALFASLANYKHAEWWATPDRKLEVGYFTLDRAKFEAMFADEVTPPPPTKELFTKDGRTAKMNIEAVKNAYDVDNVTVDDVTLSFSVRER